MSVMPKVLGLVVGAAMLVPLGCREKKVVVHRQGPPERVVVVERQPDVVIVQPPPRGKVIYVREGPPTPRREAMGRRPSPGHIWVGGYWAWHRDGYVWMPGHWAVPPRERAAWVGHTWHHTKEGWYVSGGHWK